MAHLALLPPELKLHLLEFLPAIQHCLALARTCREWHRHAIAAAYHKVRFTCRDEGGSHRRALAMLAPDNVGVKHIKHLTLVPSQAECDPGECEGGMEAVLGLFAYLLPAHQLSTLSVDSCHVLDPELVTILHRRQRYLQNLRLDGWRTGTDNCLSENLLQEGNLIDVSHVSHLQLFISNKWQAEWFNIPALPALAYLEVHVDAPSIIASDGQDIRDPQNHWGLSRTILEDVFVADGFHERLKGLALQGLDLQDAGPLLKPILRSQNLITLTLQHCRNVGLFLRFCADDELLLPGLKTLSVANPPDRPYNRPYCTDTIAINALLMRLTGLTHLLLSLTVLCLSQPTIQVKAITKHAETLVYAYLDVAGLDTELFVRSLQSCTKLQQLAIPDLRRAMPLSCTSSSETITSTALETLKTLKDLRSLYILDDLQNFRHDAIPTHSTVCPALRARRLADFATSAFEAAPHLHALGVGRRKKVHSVQIKDQHQSSSHIGQCQRHDSHQHYFQQGHHHPHGNSEWQGGQQPSDAEPPRYFRRGERWDADGGKMVAATEVRDLLDLQAVEPRSEVFDVVADSNRMLRVQRLESIMEDV